MQTPSIDSIANQGLRLMQYLVEPGLPLTLGNALECIPFLGSHHIIGASKGRICGIIYLTYSWTHVILTS